MKVDLSAELPLGTKLTIAGVEFGPQYEHGFTVDCEPGRETVMVIKEIYPSGATLERFKPRAAAIPVPPKLARSYGPARRRRWK